MDDIRTPFITAALDRRDNPGQSPPPEKPLTGYWLTAHPDDDQ